MKDTYLVLAGASPPKRDLLITYLALFVSLAVFCTHIPSTFSFRYLKVFRV